MQCIGGKKWGGGEPRFNLLKESNSNAEAKEKFKDLNYVQDNLVVTKL